MADAKHAMHLIRLQRMGLEAMTTGRVNVTRHDREELLAIRDGLWTFSELEEQADQADTRLRDARASSTLPEAPDETFLNTLCIHMI
jgi:uncharacterized protein